VIALVHGDPAEISNHLIPHPVIRKITLTGSTPIGKLSANLQTGKLLINQPATPWAEVPFGGVKNSGYRK